jgi:hypothetical protein
MQTWMAKMGSGQPAKVVAQEPKSLTTFTVNDDLDIKLTEVEKGAILGTFFISARKKTNIDTFRQLLYKKVREMHVQKYPYNDFLYTTYDDEGNNS